MEQSKQTNQPNNKEEYSPLSLQINRRKIVNLYLLSREYSNKISDEDQLKLRKIERSQTALFAGCCLFFIGGLASRHFLSSKIYSNLYKNNFIYQSLSRVPYAAAHTTNLFLLFMTTKVYDNYAIQLSIDIISKYDPEAKRIMRFNKILI